MNINLPATITAEFQRYSSYDTWYKYPDYPDAVGFVTIYFGGSAITSIEVRGKQAFRLFEEEGLPSDQQEELNEFVASWLTKIFQGALANG